MCCCCSLLAMGVDQFGHMPNKYVFIRDYLVPNRTSNQLTFRFKNLNSSRRKQENAVKVWLLRSACEMKMWSQISVLEKTQPCLQIIRITINYKYLVIVSLVSLERRIQRWCVRVKLKQCLNVNCVSSLPLYSVFILSKQSAQWCCCLSFRKDTALFANYMCNY